MNTILYYRPVVRRFISIDVVVSRTFGRSRTLFIKRVLKMGSCLWILLVTLSVAAAVVPLTVQEMNDILTHLRAYQKLLAVQRATAGSMAQNTGVQTAATSPFNSFPSSIGMGLPASKGMPNLAINTPTAQISPTSSTFSSPGSISPTSSVLRAPAAATFRTSAAPLPTTSGQRPILTSFASTTIERPPPPTIASPPTIPPPTPEVTTLPPVTTTESLQSLPEAFRNLETDLRKYLILFHNYTDRFHKKGKDAGDEATQLEYQALYEGGSKGHAFKIRAEGLRNVETFNVESFKTMMEVKKDVEEFMMAMNMRSAQVESMYPPAEPAPLPL